jgi:hypothetical protein
METEGLCTSPTGSRIEKLTFSNPTMVENPVQPTGVLFEIPRILAQIPSNSSAM